MRQADRVLDRHAGALREVLQHRMGGVAEEDGAAVEPALDRLAVAQHPEPPVAAVADDLAGALCTWPKPCMTSASQTGLPATGSGASLW